MNKNMIENNIKKNERIKNKINLIMGTAPAMLITSSGLLTLGVAMDNNYLLVGSIAGAVAGIGTAIHNYNIYNYDRVVASPLGPDDGVWEVKSLKKQYEDADNEIKRLRKK